MKAVDDGISPGGLSCLFELAPGLLDTHRVRAGGSFFELCERAEETRRHHRLLSDSHVPIEILAIAVASSSMMGGRGHSQSSADRLEYKDSAEPSHPGH